MAHITHDATQCPDLDCPICEEPAYVAAKGDLVEHAQVPGSPIDTLGAYIVLGFCEQGAILRNVESGAIRCEPLNTDCTFQRQPWQGGFVPVSR